MATKKTTQSRPVASVCAVTGALTLVLLDRALLDAWEPLLEEPEDDDIGGHPQKVIELLEADESFTSGPLAVGKGSALVLNLEGVSGEAEVYRMPGGVIALVEPTRSWWDDEDNFGHRASDVEAMFREALAAVPTAGRAAGKVANPSGALLAFDANADLSRAGKTLKKPLAEGDVKRFGRDGDGLVLMLPAGTFSVRRRVFKPKWGDGNEFVVGYLIPEAASSSRDVSAKKVSARKASAKRSSAKKASAERKAASPKKGSR